MEEKGLDKVAAFDTLFTTNHVQMLKILSAYLPPSLLQHLAVYIKIAELQYTLQFFQRYPHASIQTFPHEDSFDGTKLCEEVLPFCSPSEAEQLTQMKNMLEQFKNMQDMMEMMQMMQEMSEMTAGEDSDGTDHETTNSSGFSGFPDNLTDMLSMLSGMPNMF